MSMTNKSRVIFFDGVCGLCNSFVDFIISIDKEKKFSFSPLQSEFAKQQLGPIDVEELKSVVVNINGQTYRKSLAVFQVLRELGGGWKLLSGLNFLPNRFLDFGYDLVAENRYRLFGKKDSCRLPTPEERERFIL